MTNYELFEQTLTKHYTHLFESDPEYEYSAARCTPESLAGTMTASLRTGGANKEGKGIKYTCKDLRIKHTYKAIKEFLNQS